jgi:glutathione S-transferase
MMNGLNSKHLRAVDDCPTVEKEKLTLYHTISCPFAHRSVLVAIAKQIPTNVVNCRLRESRPAFLSEKSRGMVPAI